MVKGWYERRATLESSILRRQVEILYKTFASGQGDEGALRRIKELDAEANAIYSNHRAPSGIAFSDFAHREGSIYGAVEQQTFLISLTMLLTGILRIWPSAPGEARHRQNRLRELPDQPLRGLFCPDSPHWLDARRTVRRRSKGTIGSHYPTRGALESLRLPRDPERPEMTTQ